MPLTVLLEKPFTDVSSFIGWVDGLVWGIVMMVLIIAVGITLSVRTKFHAQRKLGLSLRYAVTNEEGAEGDVSSFGALTTALAATVGTGNIVGVATAIMTGGPGALFWMEFAAFFGIATKYAEGVLAVKYRHVKEDGSILGGPFYYIEDGMGPKWKWLAKLFALFGSLAGALGIGTSTQMNGIVGAICRVVDPEETHKLIGNYSAARVITTAIITIAVILVIIGGIERIAQVTERIVPAMMVLYVVSALLVFFCNIKNLPYAIVEVFSGAFGFRPVAGGAIGFGALWMAMQKGVARGIFSNEAGLGSAPIAAAAAQTKECVRQGMVSSTGTFLDTIVICTLTGLCIIMTKANYFTNKDGKLLEGVQVTIQAFSDGLPFPPIVGAVILALSLGLFAFSTILGWDYYAERCFDYLTNGNKSLILGYRWIYVAAVAIGPFVALDDLWNFADIMNGLMAFPNVVALFALSGVVALETKDFWGRKISGEYDDGLEAAKAAKKAAKAGK